MFQPLRHRDQRDAADGTQAHRVTQRHVSTTVRAKHRLVDNWPQWSPDGTRLVFERGDNTRFISKGVVAHAIFTVRLDGTGYRRLTPWGLDAAQPDWSADGKWILFRSQESGERQNNLFLVHPNGTSLHQITHTFGGTYTWASYTFSPDGRFITAARSPGHGKAGNADVYVMNVDGTGLRDITNAYPWRAHRTGGRRPSRRQVPLRQGAGVGVCAFAGNLPLRRRLRGGADECAGYRWSWSSFAALPRDFAVARFDRARLQAQSPKGSAGFRPTALAAAAVPLLRAGILPANISAVHIG